MIQMERYVLHLVACDLAENPERKLKPYGHTFRLERLAWTDEKVGIVGSTPYGAITATMNQGWSIEVGRYESGPVDLFGGGLGCKGAWTLSHLGQNHESVFDALWSAFYTLKRLDTAIRLAPPPPLRPKRTEISDT